MELIDKDAILSKIDNLKHKIDDRYRYSNGWKDALRMLEAELNTLEVKDVDEIIKTAEDHAYLAGSEKMREKIMAKAVDAVVSQVPCTNEIIFYSPHTAREYSNIITDMTELGLEKGDLVKLIVIKTQKEE